MIQLEYQIIQKNKSTIIMKNKKQIITGQKIKISFLMFNKDYIS